MKFEKIECPRVNILTLIAERERGRVIRVILQIRFQFSNVIPKRLGYLFP